MSNLQENHESSFEHQIEAFTTGLVSAITALSPLLLIIIILGIAGANGFVEYLYQLGIFGSYAIVPAVLVAGLRFASGMGGIALIKKAKYIVGIFFMAVSLALTFYTWWHVDTIAETIAPAAVKSATFTISMILWGGFVGELMIAAYMGSMSKSGNSLPAVTWWKSNGQSSKQPAASANGNGKH